MKKQNHGDNDEYIKDLEEWMDHQYDPGYWTGGYIPPHIKYLKRPPRILLELLGVLIIALAVLHIYNNFESNSTDCLFDLIWIFLGGLIAISNFRKKS